MTPFDLRTDTELLRASDDPVEAFAVFYRRHVDGLLRFAASRGATAEVAADIVADAFLVALRSRHKYIARSDDARPWLIGIAANRLLDRHRRHARDAKRQRELETYADRLTPRDLEGYSQLEHASEHDPVSLLDDLPEVQQRVVRERVLGDRDYSEIAGDLGLSEQTARQHVSRGLARLRTQLGRNR